MAEFDQLTASVKALPMPIGLYRFSVSSARARIAGDDREIALPAFQVGLCPGVASEDVEIVSSPAGNGGWLCDQRDDLVLNVKASTVLLLTSLRGEDATPLEIEVERLDPHAPARAAGQAPPADIAHESSIDPVLLVEHPAWREARDTIFAAAAAGPATLAILGPAGAGKTLLLRDLASAFRQRGLSVTQVRQGEFCFDLTAGGIVLIDEASRVDAERLVELADQREGLVILAGPPEFSSRLSALPRPPMVISLRPLKAREVGAFVTGWMERLSVPTEVVTGDAIEQLIIRSGCIPRLVTQILGYALAAASAAGKTSVGAGDIDEAADVRIWPLETTPVPAPPPALAPPRPDETVTESPPDGIAPTLEAASSEASVAQPAVLPAWLPNPPPARVNRRLSPIRRRFQFARLQSGRNPSTPNRPARVRYAAVVSLALVATVALTGAFLGTSAQSERPAKLVRTEVGLPPPPESAPLAGMQGDVGSASPDAPPRLAMISPPIVAEPPGDASSDGMRSEKSVDSPPYPPGLMLVARAGDTLQTLYARVYRGVRPPPYAEVAAANPVPLGPGVILVFPAPPDGWVQRVGLR